MNNGYIWGEDTIRGQDYCVITEGIADAIVLMQNGIPVLSPVTTKFAGHDRDVLLAAAKRLETVYICNDNEDSGAGEDGAIRTGLLLKSEGVDVKIVLLPREDESKVDVAEYFLKHTKGDFERVREESTDILAHLLKKVEVSKKIDPVEAKTENTAKATEFVKKTLICVKDEDKAVLFIRNNIKQYFTKFTAEDTNTLKKIYKAAIEEEKERTQKRTRSFRLTWTRIRQKRGSP